MDKDTLTPAQRIAQLLTDLNNPESPDGISPTVARAARETLAEELGKMLPAELGLYRSGANDEAYIDHEGKARITVEFDTDVGVMTNTVRQSLVATFDGEELSLKPATHFMNDLAGDASQDYSDLTQTPGLRLNPESGSLEDLAEGVRDTLATATGQLARDRNNLTDLVFDHVADGLNVPSSMSDPRIEEGPHHPVMVLNTQEDHDLTVRITPAFKEGGWFEAKVDLVQKDAEGNTEVLSNEWVKARTLSDLYQEGVDCAATNLEKLTSERNAVVNEQVAAVRVLKDNGYLAENSRDMAPTVVGRTPQGTKLFVHFGGGDAGSLNKALAELGGVDTKHLLLVKGAHPMEVAVLKREGQEPLEATVKSFIDRVNERLPRGAQPLELGAIRGTQLEKAQELGKDGARGGR